VIDLFVFADSFPIFLGILCWVSEFLQWTSHTLAYGSVKLNRMLCKLKDSVVGIGDTV